MISPPSGVRSPWISRNSVDLPTPFRPIRPTLAPTGRSTLARSKNFRPQPLKTRLSICSMPGALMDWLGRSLARRGGALSHLQRNRAQKVALADIDAEVAQDGVGGGAMEIKVRQHEVVEVVVAF